MKVSAYEALKERIESRGLTIAVIGLGYVGLPLAAAFAEVGFRVIGIDVDEKKVRLVNRGVSYIEDMASERLKSLVDQGLLRATSQFDRLRFLRCRKHLCSNSLAQDRGTGCFPHSECCRCDR